MTDPFSESSSIPAEKTELSEREREILKLLATGVSNKEIAQQLFISPNTVKVHLRNIFAKTGAASRTEATLFAIRTGLVQIEMAVVEPEPAPLPAHPPTVTEPQPSQPQLPAEIIQPAPRPQGWAWAGLIVAALLVVGGAWWWASTSRTLPVANTALPPVIVTPPPRWAMRAPVPTARQNFGMAAYDHQIYLIGGETSQPSNLVERYQPAENTWQTLADLPEALTEIGAAVIGGKIYVPGGRLGSGAITDTLWLYDPQQNRWAARAPIPHPISAYALATFEGHLFVLGGWDGEAYQNSVWEYTPDTNTWRARAPMPTARAQLAATLANGKIYAMGGTAGESPLATVEIYDPTQEDSAAAWSAGAALPSGRAGLVAASAAELIHIFGGEGQPPLKYVLGQTTWEPVETPPANLNIYWGVVLIGSEFYVVGGDATDSAVAVYVYQAIYTTAFPVVGGDK